VLLQAVSIPPTGFESRIADRPWRAVGRDLSVAPGVPFGWGTVITGTGAARIAYGEQAVLAVEGEAWSIEFAESALTLETDIRLVASLLGHFPLVIQFALPGTDFTLAGAQASIQFDGTETVIDLIAACSTWLPRSGRRSTAPMMPRT